MTFYLPLTNVLNSTSLNVVVQSCRRRYTSLCSVSFHQLLMCGLLSCPQILQGVFKSLCEGTLLNFGNLERPAV